MVQLSVSSVVPLGPSPAWPPRGAAASLSLFCSSIKLEFNFELSPLVLCVCVLPVPAADFGPAQAHTHTDTHTWLDRNFDVDVNFICVHVDATNFVVNWGLSFAAPAVLVVVVALLEQTCYRLTHTHTHTHTHVNQNA